MSSESWIRFEGVRYDVRPGERALEAMLRQGAPVTFSCRKGTCRACMLQAESGDPGAAAIAPLPEQYRALGFFLPCCADAVEAVEAVRADLSLCVEEALVAEAFRPAPDILCLRLEPMRALSWVPGQVIDLMNGAGESRPFSVVSAKDDYYLEVHIRVRSAGAVSAWAAGLGVGDSVRFRGPRGGLVWHESLADRPLLLVGTGTGGGVLAGIARHAVASGHRGRIRLFHGGRGADDLYLGPWLSALPKDRVEVVQAASREAVGDMHAARITDLAFADGHDLADTAVFLSGNPDMVETARIQAVAAGAALDRIYADPFEPPVPYAPRDAQKLKVIEADPELWEALGEGATLTRILEEFYAAVYEDPLLAPFFHRVTKQRAIEKQYSFLQDLFHGTKLYFGEKPFNAHHWMVISDEVFDHREALFFGIVRRHGVPEPMIRRWAALHEMFRREIVKPTPRGVLREGMEVHLEGYSREVLDIGAVCDGCSGEVPPGSTVRMHVRTGEIFCAKCEGRDTTNAA